MTYQSPSAQTAAAKLAVVQARQAADKALAAAQAAEQQQQGGGGNGNGNA